MTTILTSGRSRRHDSTARQRSTIRRRLQRDGDGLQGLGQVMGAGRATGVDKFVRRKFAGESELQKIRGEGWGPFVRFGGIGVAECEYGKRAAGLCAMKFSRFFFAEGAEFACAALNGGGGHVVRESGGAGARATRVGKNVEIVERTGVDEIEGGGVIGFGFAGEAG